MEKEQPKKSSAREFLEKNWPWVVAAAGIGVTGTAVWLTVRYLRERRQMRRTELEQLTLIEEDAIGSQSEATKMLVLGGELSLAVGREAVSAASELAEATDDPKLKEGLETLAEVAKMGKRLR